MLENKFALAFLFVSLAFIGTGVYFYQSAKSFENQALLAKGEVVSVKRQHVGKGRQPLQIHQIKYTTKEGKEITTQLTLKTKTEAGKSLEILYLPSDPTNISEKGAGSKYEFPIFFLITGIVFFLFSLYMLFKGD